jgi:hypothetical protein
MQADLSAHLTKLAPAWLAVLGADEVKRALDSLSAMLAQRLRSEAVIYPAQPFRALESLTPQAVRVVILGQDPYHGAGQAQGLAFSVPDGVARPPSLRNILNEIELEYPDDPTQLVLKPNADQNDLSRWVRQGVLLLNTSLTVEDGQPPVTLICLCQPLDSALVARSWGPVSSHSGRSSRIRRRHSGTLKTCWAISVSHCTLGRSFRSRTETGSRARAKG